MIRERHANGERLSLATIEQTVLDAVRLDGARLLEGLLNEIASTLTVVVKPGEHLHSHPARMLTTVLGPMTLRRAYYRGPQGGRYPFDEALGIHDQYTPAVIHLMCWAAAMDSSFELASATLSRFAGLTIPGRQIQRVVNVFGPQAEAFMQNRKADRLHKTVDVLNIQTDMTGIPARPEELEGIQGKQPDGSAKTRQIKLGCIFTQSKGADAHPLRDPSSSTYLAAFTDPGTFGNQLWEEALKRGYASARKVVFLGDGAEWIWNLVQERFKGVVEIVDFYHACEHLHDLCKILETDEVRSQALFKRWRYRLKNNGLPGILTDVRARLPHQKPEVRENLEKQLPYFVTNSHRMTYKTFRKQGFFIGSGAIEGACRHIVAQRTKLSGMRWLCSGAQHVLAFRCLIKSNLFDNYCNQFSAAA